MTHLHCCLCDFTSTDMRRLKRHVFNSGCGKRLMDKEGGRIPYNLFHQMSLLHFCLCDSADCLMRRLVCHVFQDLLISKCENIKSRGLTSRYFREESWGDGGRRTIGKYVDGEKVVSSVQNQGARKLLPQSGIISWRVQGIDWECEAWLRIEQIESSFVKPWGIEAKLTGLGEWSEDQRTPVILACSPM